MLLVCSSMSNLTRFPFISMIRIINFLHLHETESEIYSIMDASNACYPDTMEVLEMLSYLTAFGQVKKQNIGWIISNKQSVLSTKKFREHFLVDIVKILNVLNESEQSVDNLRQNLTDLNEETIGAYLKFLEKITAYGVVQRNARNWRLEKFIPVQEIQS